MNSFLQKLKTGDGIYKIIRYVFIGGLTTLVSIVSFWLLERVAGLNTNAANAISIVLAVTFAYITNKLVVFRSKCGTRAELIKEALSFCSARAVTMVIEFLGLMLLHDLLQIDSMISKIIVTIVVIILNYVLSRLLVFNKSEAFDTKR